MSSEHDQQDHERAEDGQGALGRRRAERAELAQALIARAKFLPEDDAALILAVYRDGVMLKQIAAMMRRPASSVGHRVRMLVARLSSPRFGWCVRQLERQASRLAPPTESWCLDRQRVATLRILHGRPLREIARRAGLSVHHVRRHLAAIDAIYHARSEPERLPRPDLRRSA